MMGIVELFILIFLTVLAGALTVWGLAELAPNHPAFIDRIVWFIVVLVIVVAVAFALGLQNFDPRVPSLRGPR